MGCAPSHEEIDFLGDGSKKFNTSVFRPSKLPGFTGYKEEFDRALRTLAQYWCFLALAGTGTGGSGDQWMVGSTFARATNAGGCVGESKRFADDSEIQVLVLNNNTELTAILDARHQAAVRDWYRKEAALLHCMLLW